MADVAVTNSEGPVQHMAAQKGYREFHGVAAFNSTDATSTLKVPGFTVIDNVQLTWGGAPASDEILYCTAGTDGKVAISSGKITIGRTGASKTSALKFHFRVRGR